jgi:hypothetical protein
LNNAHLAFNPSSVQIFQHTRKQKLLVSNIFLFFTFWLQKKKNLINIMRYVAYMVHKRYTKRLCRPDEKFMAFPLN